MGTGIPIGIDIGATKTRMAFAANGELHPFYQEPTPQEPDEAVDAIVAGIRHADLPAEIAGIGIGCPGPLDHEQGVIMSPPNLLRWNRFRLVERLSDVLNVPVVLDNDANVGALGEAIHGAGEGCSTVLYVTISTGIGAGIVKDGKLHRGAFGLAGEIWAYEPRTFFGDENGFNIIDLSSGNGLVARASERIAAGAVTTIPIDDIGTRSIIAAFESGDPLAAELIETARRALASALVFSLYLLAPDIVVLGGGLCTEPSWFVNPVQESVKRLLSIDALKAIPIVRARHVDRAVLYGALALLG